MMKPIATLTDHEFSDLVRAANALPDAPPKLIQATIAKFAAAQPNPIMAAATEVMQRIRAVLTFDSWTASPAALGLRSMPAPTQTRHMMFSAQGRDIDLRIVSSADSFVLAGQILGPDETGLVELSVDTHNDRAAQTLRTTSLDDLGSFRLEDIRAGTYWMTLKLGSDAVELPPISVGRQAG